MRAAPLPRKAHDVSSAAPANSRGLTISRIYLDHAATTALRPEARSAMEEGFRLWANPSSPHSEGRRAKAALEDARGRMKQALGWNGEVIFTSGASEALAIGLQRAKAGRQIASAIEHDAVFRAAPEAEIVSVRNGSSEIDREQLADLLKGGNTPIVAIQHVNSETGAIQPVDELTAQVRSAGGLTISDCAQSAGKLGLPDADMIVISAHKFGGPIGIGALLVKDFAMLEPGGGHERGYRQGTENLPGALGMAAAVEIAGYADWAVSTDQMAEFAQFVPSGERPEGAYCNHIHALSHPTMRAQALLIRLDAMGFAVSAGSACSSGTLKKSRVLDAIGYSDDAASRTIRVSLGWNSTARELEQFAESWTSLI